MNQYYYVVGLLLVMFVSLMYGIYSYADNPKAPQPKTYSVYKFGAEWCPGCVQLDKSFKDEKVKQHLQENRIDLYVIDVDSEKALSDYYKVKTIPCIIFLENKEQSKIEIKRHVGFLTPEQLTEWLNRNI